MLEAIRSRAQTWIAKVILALITIPFALWGIDSYVSGGGEPPVAEVGDDSVGQREFFRALHNKRDSIQERTHSEVDIENKAFRQEVLDQLVNMRLISIAARHNGMAVPAGQLDAVIRSAPIFQVNGEFSEQRFQAWMRDQGMGEKELAGLIEREALAQQFQAGYGQGTIVASASAERLSALMAQQREVHEAIFAADSYLSSVSVSDETVAAEYQANQGQFAIPAQVRVQYLALSVDAIRAGIKVADETVQQFYESNKARYQNPEQRRASHILIKVDAGGDKAAAKAKAEQIQQQVKAAPGKFAELARQHSQDPGSAALGGDLGNFTRETMVKPFADAVFTMKPGEISAPVETEFGYHVIRLESVTPGDQIPLASVRQEIIEELAMREAERKYAESAERFSNLVYEQADSLEPAAKELGLTVRETGWISRDQADPAYLAKPEMMDALFSPDALEKQHNTEAIELGRGTLVAARVLEHKPAGVRPLAEVADNIKARLKLKAARDKAIESGKAALAAMNAGQPVSGTGAPMLISRMKPLNLPAEAVKAVFKANTGKLPVSVGVETREGYRLYRISRVIEAEPDENRRKMIQRDLVRLASQEEFKAYLAYLKSSIGVEVNAAVLEKKAD